MRKSAMYKQQIELGEWVTVDYKLIFLIIFKSKESLKRPMYQNNCFPDCKSQPGLEVEMDLN